MVHLRSESVYVIMLICINVWLQKYSHLSSNNFELFRVRDLHSPHYKTSKKFKTRVCKCINEYFQRVWF